MKRQKMFRLGFFCILLTCIALWSVGARAATPMPDFALENVLDGKIVDSKSFQGKVLLLTFFATWCPPCVEEIPTLVKLQKDLSAAGFSVIGLSVDQQGPAPVAKFIEKKGEGIHHIAFAVDDIEMEMKRLTKAGFEFINKTPKKGADNKLIAFLHPKSTNGVLIELCQEIG